jgi:hypothetical protein
MAIVVIVSMDSRIRELTKTSKPKNPKSNIYIYIERERERERMGYHRGPAF